jgi:hypothetical protein
LEGKDLVRELTKIHDVLIMVDRHLSSKDEMNAALHMAASVRSTPLSVAVRGAMEDLAAILGEDLAAVGED